MPCLCLEVHLEESDSITKTAWRILPPPSWFLHFRETGEALPELVGDVEMRPEPASRAMIVAKLQK
jgi:hypothetical protein